MIASKYGNADIVKCLIEEGKADWKEDVNNEVSQC